MKNPVILTVLVLLLSLPSALFSQETFREKQESYILFLFNKGRYFDTIAETRRYMSYRGIGGADLDYFILTNYFLGAQYGTAVHRISSLRDRGPDLREEVLLSQSFLKLGDAKRSAAVIASTDPASARGALRYDVMLRKIEAFLGNNEFSAALDAAKSQEDFFSGDASYRSLLSDLEGYRELRYRHQSLAILLSALVPGAGQVYSGRSLDGLLSLLGVAGTLAGGLYLYHRNEKGMAITLFFFSGIFYGGTVYGAYNACGRYNDSINEKFKSGVLRTHVPEYDPMQYVDRNRLFR